MVTSVVYDHNVGEFQDMIKEEKIAELRGHAASSTTSNDRICRLAFKEALEIWTVYPIFEALIYPRDRRDYRSRTLAMKFW